VKIILNGETHEIEPGTTVATLLTKIGAPASGIAVARNESVVRRSEYASYEVREGDAIEVIKAVAGG
jgi:sulfur carrier protein